MSADETKVSRINAANVSGVTATVENVPPQDDAEIASRSGVATLTIGEAHRLCWDDVCLEEERAQAALEAENYQEAARLFEPLAERGSAEAQAMLGWMHMYGHLGPPDVAKAIAALEKAAAVPGYGDAKYLLGLALLKKGDHDSAETVFRDGASENDSRCIHELMHLEETRAWEALDAGNDAQAARLFEPLVARGSTYAMVHLGRIYARGALGAPDLKKAMALWEDALRLGSVNARYTMARSLRRTGDEVRARALFLEGAEQHDKPCTYWAGRMLVRGEGGPTDREAGVALLTRAANAGHIYARRELLGLEFKDERSMLGRLRVRGKFVLLALTIIRRGFREPDLRHSDDLY